jgi:hypothetical protein
MKFTPAETMLRTLHLDPDRNSVAKVAALIINALIATYGAHEVTKLVTESDYIRQLAHLSGFKLS